MPGKTARFVANEGECSGQVELIRTLCPLGSILRLIVNSIGYEFILKGITV